MTLKIGADPEFFLKKHGYFHSGFGIIPGDKHTPHPVPCGAIQVDGMAIEFNINPAENKEVFVNNIDAVLNTLRNMIPKDFDFAFEPVAIFEEEHFKRQPFKARELGCDPDYNAYTGRVNPPPNGKQLMRTAAGHIHIGWGENIGGNNLHLLNCKALIKQLDYILGIPSLLLDSNSERRKMYGKAGAFRPKPYGVEYRVLSNFWLRQPTLMEWVFEHTTKAFKLLTENNIDLYKEYGNTAKEIINKNDVKKAETMLLNELNSFVDMDKIK